MSNKIKPQNWLDKSMTPLYRWWDFDSEIASIKIIILRICKNFIRALNSETGFSFTVRKRKNEFEIDFTKEKIMELELPNLEKGN